MTDDARWRPLQDGDPGGGPPPPAGPPDAGWPPPGQAWPAPQPTQPLPPDPRFAPPPADPRFAPPPADPRFAAQPAAPAAAPPPDARFAPPGYAAAHPAGPVGAAPWAAPAQDLLPPPPRRAPRRGALVAAVVASAVAVSGVAVGGYLVWGAVGGGGDQPEKHLPATAMAFAKVDLDPSAGQKLGAIRFARKFPGGRDLREDGDPREWLWKNITDGVENAPPWSSAQQWIGDRAAVALLPAAAGSELPTPVAVVAVTDPVKAEADLDALPDVEAVTAEGWAYVAATQEQARAALDGVAAGSLADAPDFAADVERLGEDGIAALWADGDALQEVVAALPAGGSAVMGGRQLSGRTALALRFTGDDLELAGFATGQSAASRLTGTGTGVETLPDGTVAAFGASGLGPALAESWDEFQDGFRAGAESAGQDPDLVLGTLADELGLTLPDDLVALLGTRTTLAVGGPDAGGLPSVGVAVQTDADVRPAVRALRRLSGDVGLPFDARVVDGGWTGATSPEWGDALAAGGALGSSERFAEAVPDAGRAAVVGYVDVEAALAAYGADMPPEDRADLEALSAVGLTVVSAPNGDSELRFKVTTR